MLEKIRDVVGKLKEDERRAAQSDDTASDYK